MCYELFKSKLIILSEYFKDSSLCVTIIVVHLFFRELIDSVISDSVLNLGWKKIHL